MDKTLRFKRWSALLLLVGLCALVQLCRVHRVDHDMYHMMALASEAIAQGTIPTGDCWAYSDTLDSVVHHEWLLGMILMAVHSVAGDLGIGLFQLCLAICVVSICWRANAVRGGHAVAFAVVSLIAVPMIWASSNAVRAQTMTLCFTAFAWYCVGLDRRGQRTWAVAYPFVVLIWQNIHAGFVVGWGILGLYAAERLIVAIVARQKITDSLRNHGHLYLLVLSALPISLLNPYGALYLSYLWHALPMSRPMIAEWLPLWDYSNEVALFLFWGLGVAAIVVSCRHARGGKWAEPLFLVIVAFNALLHVRHVSLFGVCLLALAPSMIRSARFFVELERDARMYSRQIQIASGVAGVCLAMLLVGMRCWEIPQSEYIPVGVADYMETHAVRGRVFTPFEAGAYLAWRRGPQIQVSLDSRYEVAYPVEQADERIGCFLALAGWQATLEKDAADWLVLPRKSQLASSLFAADGISAGAPSLAARLPKKDVQSRDRKWTAVYVDADFMLCKRVEMTHLRLGRNAEPNTGGSGLVGDFGGTARRNAEL